MVQIYGIHVSTWEFYKLGAAVYQGSLILALLTVVQSARTYRTAQLVLNMSLALVTAHLSPLL
jgi:hypothetical protein